jgi:hypothetical protein
VAVKRIFQYLVHIPTYGLWYPKGSDFSLCGYMIQIGPVTRMIGNQPLGLANFLVGSWCVGHSRSKIAYLSPPPKANTLPPQVDALNYYG